MNKFLFLLMLFANLYFIYCIHSIDEEEYKVLVDLAKGEFSVPVKQRTRIQKNAVVKFWRSNGKFLVDGDILFYEGKKVSGSV